MSVSIYNSLTKKKEPLVPIDGKTIKMYSCGVTVYDHCHIGHARSLYIFNVIITYLRYRKYDVHFVRNITDVDDKIINKAIELKKEARVVSEENIESYYQDLKSLGIAKADKEPKATENIDGMITMIESLIEKGFAYDVDGDVYFNIRQFKTYGKLSGQSIEKMMDAVRIEADAKKKDPLDFALWKKSKQGEPSWESPWGAGRPGWHIECSCMSLKHLNCETLDIHAGGRDLIFPHHENEIAQAEAATGKPFAKYWIHHGLLTIRGQKMAKSLGNFITIKDALEKYSVDQLKMFYLTSHYASPIDFTEEKMEEANKVLERFQILFHKTKNIVSDPALNPVTADFIDQHKKSFIEAMDDDFNTARGLASLFELLNDTNKFLDQKKDNDKYQEIVLCAVLAIKEFATEVFGLFASEKEEQLTEEEARLIDERKAAREDKDFKRSDELRDLLKSKGISVEDTKEGQIWRRG